MNQVNSENVFPVSGETLPRSAKENLLGQKGMILWLTGLSGSGKSTIAKKTEILLHAKGLHTKLLDGDNFRSGLNSDLGFSAIDRKENIRRVAEVAKMFLDNGLIVICTFISPTREIREMCKRIIGENDFFEVAVFCPLEECEKRDVKGLYAKARSGEIHDFTGIHQEYEEPLNPHVLLNTERQPAVDSAGFLAEFVVKAQGRQNTREKA